MTEGELIARYIALRNKKNKMKAEHDEALKPYSDALAKIENHFLGILNERQLDNLKSEDGTVYKSIVQNVKIVDRAKLIDYIMSLDDDGGFDIFTNALSKDYVAAYVERHGVAPPGVQVDPFTKINVRKS